MDKPAPSLFFESPRQRGVLSRLRTSTLFVTLLTAGVALHALLIADAAAQVPVDLELVIAVDVSLSMDLDEQRLQRDGYVTAFRDTEIHKAITSGPHARIAVTYMEWAGPSSQAVVIDWSILDGPRAARAFADKLEAAPISRARLTSISTALKFSKDLFATSGVNGVRRVVDVSGDGPNNAGPPVTLVRDDLVASGIVINGLPIMLKASTFSSFDLSDLDRYYADCVIGGTGAFVVPIRELTEFKSATRRKLLLEISGLPLPARAIPVQNSAPADTYDCMAGERQWRWFQERIPN